MVSLAISNMLVLRIVDMCSELKFFYIEIHAGEITLTPAGYTARAHFAVREWDGAQLTIAGGLVPARCLGRSRPYKEWQGCCWRLNVRTGTAGNQVRCVIFLIPPLRRGSDSITHSFPMSLRSNLQFRSTLGPVLWNTVVCCTLRWHVMIISVAYFDYWSIIYIWTNVLNK